MEKVKLALGVQHGVGPAMLTALQPVQREHGSSAELGGLSPGGGVGSISLHPHAAEVTEVSSALWVRLGYGGRSCLFYSCNEGSMGGYG